MQPLSMQVIKNNLFKEEMQLFSGHIGIYNVVVS